MITFQIEIAHTFYNQKLLHGLEPIPFLKDRFWRGCGSLQIPNRWRPQIHWQTIIVWETRATYNLSCTRDWIWEYAGPEHLLWYALKMHWRCSPEPFQQKNILSLILRHPLDAQNPALPATYKIHCKPPSNPACDLLTGLVKKPQRLAAWRIVSGTGIFPGWFIREKPLLLTWEVVNLYVLLATIDLPKST